MSALAEVFNMLGQTVMPIVGAAAFPDTMTIKSESASTIGTGGERIKGTTTDAYTAVPVAYEPTQIEKRVSAGDRPISSLQYTLTLPTHYTDEGTVKRINLDPKLHRLIVNARGNEPAKTFRILAIRDISGVVFEAVCEKEG